MWASIAFFFLLVHRLSLVAVSFHQLRIKNDGHWGRTVKINACLTQVTLVVLDAPCPYRLLLTASLLISLFFFFTCTLWLHPSPHTTSQGKESLLSRAFFKSCCIVNNTDEVIALPFLCWKKILFFHGTIEAGVARVEKQRHLVIKHPWEASLLHLEADWCPSR